MLTLLVLSHLLLGDVDGRAERDYSLLHSSIVACMVVLHEKGQSKWVNGKCPFEWVCACMRAWPCQSGAWVRELLLLSASFVRGQIIEFTVLFMNEAKVCMCMGMCVYIYKHWWMCMCVCVVIDWLHGFNRIEVGGLLAFIDLMHSYTWSLLLVPWPRTRCMLSALPLAQGCTLAGRVCLPRSPLWRGG